jgi:hypothetical protein
MRHIFKDRQFTSNLNRNLPIDSTDTKASKKQKEYIDILTNDLILDYRQRNAHIKSITNHEIHYLDELTKQEASLVIAKFKEWLKKSGKS